MPYTQALTEAHSKDIPDFWRIYKRNWHLLYRASAKYEKNLEGLEGLFVK
jgi:hypothetical protein